MRLDEKWIAHCCLIETVRDRREEAEREREWEEFQGETADRTHEKEEHERNMAWEEFLTTECHGTQYRHTPREVQHNEHT